MKGSLAKADWIIVVGPWMCRIALGYGTFGWREGDGPITRFFRKWWSGWFRWEDDDQW